MNLTQDQFDTIERYLTGTLSEGELRAFHDELETQADLREEVDRQQILRQSLQALADRERVKQLFAEIKAANSFADGDEVAGGDPVPIRPLRPDVYSTNPPGRDVQPLQPGPSRQIGRTPSPFIKYLVAATVVGLTLGSAFYFLLRSPADPAPDLLYRSFYQPDSAASLLPPRLSWEDGQGREVNNPAYRQTLEEAVRAYRQGQYQQSERLIRRLPERGGSAVFFQDYYIGISYLATGDIPRALRYLTAASRAPGSPPRQQAEWYLALAYLKAEKPAQTRQLLEKIRQTTGHPYQDRAREMLRKL